MHLALLCRKTLHILLSRYFTWRRGKLNIAVTEDCAMKRLIMSAPAMLVSFTLGVTGVALINRCTNYPLPDVPPVVIPTTTVIAPIMQSVKRLKVTAVPSAQLAYGWFINHEYRGPERPIQIKLKPSAKTGKVGGYILPQSSHRIYRFATISIVNDRLTFVTENINGTTYRFDGRFLNGQFQSNGTLLIIGDEAKNFDLIHELVLEGTVQKLVDGRKALEFTARFTYGAC